MCRDRADDGKAERVVQLVNGNDEHWASTTLLVTHGSIRMAAGRQGHYGLTGLQSDLWRQQSVATLHLRFAYADGDLYQRTRLRLALNAHLAAITAFRLTTTVPERLARFYESIGFSVGEVVSVPPADMALLGVAGGGTRIAVNVGEQRIELEAFDRKGRPHSENATAADLCFQYFALVPLMRRQPGSAPARMARSRFPSPAP